MAVQARHPSHAFPHDLHAFRTMDDDADAAVPGSTAFFDGYGWGAPAAGLADPSHDYGFQPRKRPRVAAGCFVEEQSVPLPPAPPEWQMPTPVGDVQGRIAASGAASTSGRTANGAAVSQQQGLMAWLHHHGVEIDALVRLESERMRAGLEAARRRHAVAVLAAVERAASARLRAAEAELARALRRGAELEEEARRVAAECQAWMGVARGHEAVAAGLRGALDELQLQRSSAGGDGCEGGGDAEDAQSCCGFEAPAPAPAPAADADAASKAPAAAACRACGGVEASVLLLPCRHLCLCPSCEAAVDACPVCAAAKNASLRVLLC